MEWQEYEMVTRYIYETLGKESRVKIEGYGKDCKVKGKSGVYHQVDVLTSLSDGVHLYKTAIECKYWKDTVNKDIIMKVSEIVEDAGINKGVIVAKGGFTPDAITFAKYKNIGLVQLREANEDGNRNATIIIKAEMLHAELLGIRIKTALKGDVESEELPTSDIKIKLKGGKEVPLKDYIESFEEELHEREVNRVVIKTHRFGMALLINTKANTATLINEMELRGVLKTNEIKFHPYDETWLIMKSIFENRLFTISKRGVIEEREFKG